jgi:hypothetical protein
MVSWWLDRSSADILENGPNRSKSIFPKNPPAVSRLTHPTSRLRRLTPDGTPFSLFRIMGH